MASTAFSAITALITGAPTSINFGLASDDTCLITAPAGETLDFSRLIVRVSNNISDIGSAGSGVRAIFSPGTTFSSIALGSYTVNVASNGTAVIGGKDFESARFLNASGNCALVTIMSSSSATTAMCTIEAYMLPGGFTA